MHTLEVSHGSIREGLATMRVHHNSDWSGTAIVHIGRNDSTYDFEIPGEILVKLASSILGPSLHSSLDDMLDNLVRRAME
jgi:hypothetical protein